MNKADLIDALTLRLGTRRDATLAVDALVDVVLREVASGGSVGITGFGTFERAERAPRTGRNPRTGQTVPIAGTHSPRFRPGTYFKKVVSDPDELPAEGLAGGRAPARTGSSGAAGPKRAAAADAQAAELMPAEDVARVESQLKDSAKKTLAKGQKADGKKGKAKKSGKGGSGKSGKSKSKKVATK